MSDELPREKRFKIILTVLIALVAAASAIVAWRAANAASAASTADLQGMDAAINRAGLRTTLDARVYQHYSAYTDFIRYRQLGSLTEDQMASQSMSTEDPGADPLVLELDHRREEAYDLASSSQPFFVTRYMERDGRYDWQRELGESWAELAQRQDLSPETHFDRADQLRSKSTHLISTLIVLAGALWFYILAGAVRHAVKYGLAGAGLVCMLAGIALAAWAELL
jgi:hypothetical protein